MNGCFVDGLLTHGLVFASSWSSTLLTPARFLASAHRALPLSTVFPGQAPLSELGDPEVRNPLFSGGRFTLGYWGIEDNPWIAEGI